MGCLQSSEGKGKKSKGSASADVGGSEAPKKVDPRLPFETYRQLFNLKNSWKSISRKLEDTAKDNLLRFLRKHPQHKLLHKDLVGYDDEDKMCDSTAFENSAVAVYNTFDEAMEKIDGDTNAAIAIFQSAGKMHAGLSNFQATYFKDMEESFVEAAREVLQDRFNEATEKNFRLLYQFASDQMIEGYNKATGQQGAGPINRV